MQAEHVVSPPFAADDEITLDETQRNRRRVRMVSKGGIEFLLNLPEARLLREGEGLRLSDGRIVKVRAAPEPLYALTMPDPIGLIKLAWQLGNRHLPAQVFPDRILIRRDHVIRDMVLGLGASVEEIEAGFNPETGAYHKHAGHSHSGGTDDHSHGPATGDPDHA